ncbi:hypothetical protein [Burkholderia pyrrocinia]
MGTREFRLGIGKEQLRDMGRASQEVSDFIDYLFGARTKSLVTPHPAKRTKIEGRPLGNERKIVEMPDYIGDSISQNDR